MLNEEAQDNEILALESIFVDGFESFLPKNEGSSDTNLKGGLLNIIIELPDPFYISFLNYKTGEPETQQIEHLPPLCLTFSFPTDYPMDSPPCFTLTSKWIDSVQLSFLCKKLDELWEENKGSEVIFTWAQYLKENTLCDLGIENILVICNTRWKTDGQSLDLQNKKESTDSSSQNLNGACSDSSTNISKRKFSKINYQNFDDHDNARKEILDINGIPVNDVYSSSQPDPRAIQDISPMCLLRTLREYDEKMRQDVFDTKQFNCKVCFSLKPGLNCIQFWPCRHVYCKDCMGSYFEIQIKEGNIKFLKCPEEKCESEAHPKQVQHLVSKDLYDRWESSLVSSTLSSLGDIQLCPRQHCQYPVTIEENRGHCPSCAFVFCGLCRFGFHGVEKCKFKSGEVKKVLDSYLSGAEEDKSNLETRYGKKYLTQLVQEYQTSNYLQQNAKTCPKCRSHIEKSEGCNKMTCKNCGSNFCWLCEKFLDRVNPYNHFNSPGSECFNMLFFGIDHDEQGFAPEDWANEIWSSDEDDL